MDAGNERHCDRRGRHADDRTGGGLRGLYGKLKGKIVLTQPARAVRMLDGRIVLRMNEKDIAEAMTTARYERWRGGRGGRGGAAGGGAGGAQAFAAQLQNF